MVMKMAYILLMIQSIEAHYKGLFLRASISICDPVALIKKDRLNALSALNSEEFD